MLSLALLAVIGEPGTVVIDLGHGLPPYADRSPREMRYSPQPDDVSGGNTSFRNEARESLVWKGSPDANGFGYFQRNRDLGQSFWPTQDVTVAALILRTGRGANAVMAGSAGAPVYVQWFEVEPVPGEALRIDDNGTPQGTRATHGFDMTLHRCDDFVRGVRYRPIHLSASAAFPQIPTTTQDGWHPENRQPGHLRYFEFRFAPGDRVTLRAGRQYAFLVGFERPGRDRGIGLANQQWVHLPEPPEFLRDPNGKPWWGLRREGNGQLPPVMSAQPSPPTDEDELARHYSQSLFPLNHRLNLMPTTDGYPDVDTYRTLEFYVIPQ